MFEWLHFREVVLIKNCYLPLYKKIKLIFKIKIDSIIKLFKVNNT